MRTGAALLLVAIAGALSIAAAPQPHCYALLVGINQYADKDFPTVPDLSCTHADCELIKSLLPTITGLSGSALTVTELYDQQATKPELLAAFDEIAALAQWQDTVVFYFSGHGAIVPDFNNEEPAGDGALILYDFVRELSTPTEQEVSSGTIIDDEMAEILRRFATLNRVFYIADCCHSGGNEREVGDLVDKGFDLPLTAVQQDAARQKAVVPMPDANRLDQQNVIAIFASDSRSKAQEIRPAGHGALTLCLSELLNSPASHDADVDGMARLDELSVGLRVLVDKTVREYSAGTKQQTSFVKALNPDVWMIPVAHETRSAAAPPPQMKGVADNALADVIALIQKQTGGAYDAGDEYYKLLDFCFLSEDKAPRPDNVFLQNELVDRSGNLQTTLRFRFSLDAPADIIALVVFTDGGYLPVFPNSLASDSAHAGGELDPGWLVASYPFEVPSPAHHGDDVFSIEILEEGWEYVVLICSPVELQSPFELTDTAYDLIYPFEELKSLVNQNGDNVGKGFGGDTPESSNGRERQAQVIAPGKKLTVFLEKYWLKQ